MGQRSHAPVGSVPDVSQPCPLGHEGTRRTSYSGDLICVEFADSSISATLSLFRRRPYGEWQIPSPTADRTTRGSTSTGRWGLVFAAYLLSIWPVVINRCRT